MLGFVRKEKEGAGHENNSGVNDRSTYKGRWTENDKAEEVGAYHWLVEVTRLALATRPAGRGGISLDPRIW